MHIDQHDLTGRGKRVGLMAVALCLSLLGGWHPSQAAEFTCAGGDVTCLIAAITAANVNGEANTIRLGAGTYTLTTVDNISDGPNGLPSITSPLSLIGAGAEATIIERATNAPRFRLVHVAAAGHLALEGLTLQGGAAGFDGIVGPGAIGGSGGGLYNAGGTAILTESTIAHNFTGVGHVGGGLANFAGTVTLTQSTIARNGANIGSGLWNNQGLVTLQNSILANNFNCAGPVTSLGHNLLSTLADCTITLLASDVIGDPRLGDFTESDTPGRGHVPLLPDSPAIDAGNDEVCPDTDQLGQPRVKVNPTRPAVCDIGAVEFQGSMPVDTTPPAITISASPTTLWPPNGKLVPVTVSGMIIDEPGGSGVNANSAAYVVTDEYGQIQPRGSLIPEADGRYTFMVALKASRRGNDRDGRHYTIALNANDHARNLGVASTTVTVPHDQGQ